MKKEKTSKTSYKMKQIEYISYLVFGALMLFYANLVSVVTHKSPTT